ncbi:platelet endothelial cell adhesion molecule isoform X2 [Brachyhypopomus gauderio]|uniref:platelet endothelial cell adhesion molecule isoform X2 n=1 Tax=Brachyhypopomus gauderio TaxID=698409 RepID=UPI004042BF60
MWVSRQSSPTCVHASLWAVLAVLLTCTEAQSGSIIKKVTLSVEPAEEVECGTNLTLTCAADASHASGVQPAYSYSFFKDYKEREEALVRPSDNVERAVYSIRNARAFHSGTYQCKVVIDGQSRKSNTQEVVVTGLQTPVLTVDKTVVREGEAVSATCRAEEEAGLLVFSIKDGSEEVYRGEGDRGHVQQLISLHQGRTAKLTCSYFIATGIRTLQSNVSGVVSVVVQELDITPSVTVLPQTGVIEGDNVNIMCSVNPHYKNLHALSLQLMKGTQILKSNMTNSTYSKDVVAADSGEYECSAQLDNVRKASFINLTVRELFSQPKVNILPSSVFEGQQFNVSCHSENFASERIREDVKYSILRNDDNVTLGQFRGEYTAVAGTKTNGNYRCSAQVGHIIKWSTSEPFKAKVLVSRPNISVMGNVVLGHPFQILCVSKNGSLPINYTLKWKHIDVNHSVSTQPEHKAVFTAIIHSEAEIHNFMCGAQNHNLSLPVTSAALSAQVIVPVQKSYLTVVPTPEDIAEGHDVYLICSIRRGTPPITFKWYRSDVERPLYSAVLSTNSSSHTLADVQKENSGTYYCEAQNYGNERAFSNKVTFTVNMARWKKALIIGACLLIVTLVVSFLLIRYRAMRGKRETAVELSVKPASPKSDDTVI